MKKAIITAITLLAISVFTGAIYGEVFTRPKGDSRFRDLSLARQPLPSAELDNEFNTVKNFFNNSFTMTQNISEWALYQSTPTYINTTVFTVPGDATDIMQAGRAIKAALNGLNVYSHVSTSSYSYITNKTTVNIEDAVLTASIATVYYGIISADRTSQPNTALTVTDIITKGPMIDVRAFTNLSTAKASSTTAGKTIVIATATTINTATIGADRAINIEKGGSITVATGKTLTMPFPNAGKYQIFSGAGTVVFNTPGAAYPEWFGAIPNNASVESITPINKALTAGGGHVDLETGTYYGNNSTIVYTGTTSISLKGKPGTVIDDSASLSPQTKLIQISGSEGLSAVLLTSAAKNDRSIVTSLSLVAGDIIKIISNVGAGQFWNGFTSDYYKGEFAEVLSTSGTTINLRNGLYDSYSASKTRVYKMNMPKVEVSNIEIKRNFSTGYGLEVRYARDLNVNNVNVVGTGDRGLYLDNLYHYSVRGCKSQTTTDYAAGYNYGISMGNSQHGVVDNNKTYGGRHGIMYGGSNPVIPNRDFAIINNYTDNNPASSTYSLDTHGNAEHFIISDNFIGNGALMSGINYIVKDNVIRENGFATGLRVYPGSDAEYISILDNTILADRAGATGLGITAPTTARSINKLLVADNVIKAGSIGISIQPPASGDLIITSAIFSNNIVYANTGRALISNYTGAYSNVFGILSITGGEYTSTASAPLYLKLAGKLSISGTAMKLSVADFASQVLGAATDVAFRDNDIYGGGLGLMPRFDHTGKLFLSGNVGVETAGDTTITANVTRVTTRTIGMNNFETESAGIPTTGSYKAGDHIINMPPTSGQPIGWYVTTSGTFSTYSTTGDTTATSKILTNVASTTGVRIGDYVTVSTGMPSAVTPYQVTGIGTGTLTIATAATSSTVGATVVTPDPTLKAEANLP